MDKWSVPPGRRDPRVLAFIPDYCLPYFEEDLKNSNLSGWWDTLSSFGGKVWSGTKSIGSTLWKGISYVPKKVYDFGYKMMNYSGNPSQIGQQGINDLAISSAEKMSIEPQQGLDQMTPVPAPSPPSSFFGGAFHGITSSLGKAANDIISTVAKVGGQATAQILAAKVAKAVGANAQDQAYNQSLAWAVQHQDQLRSMGYPGAEAGAAAALWGNNGYPPPPNASPDEILNGGGVSSLLEHYWWVPVGVIALLLLFRNER